MDDPSMHHSSSVVILLFDSQFFPPLIQSSAPSIHSLSFFSSFLPSSGRGNFFLSSPMIHDS